MGLTSALNTSLNGLVLNETTIDVVGNNIANAGTNGFKSSNVLFQTQLARTLSAGSKPTADNGGTNPRQIGLGSSVASIVKDFTQGSITNSSSPSDLAIQGDGFFIVDGPNGEQYTRNGNFALNSESLLANAQGLRLQGYGVDKDFNLVSTQLSNIEIPIGTLNVAQQTQNASLNGALLPTGTIASQGSHLLSEALTDTAAGDPTTDPIDGTTLLTSVYGSGSATPLFTAGETVSFGARKGGRSIVPATLDVSATTTVQDLLNLMDQSIGVASTGIPPIPDDPNRLPAPGPPGIEVIAGRIQVTGNSGTINDIEFSFGDLTSNGTTVPIGFTKDQSAVGESAVTDFLVYDSLGEAVTIKFSATLESTTTSSTTYRYYIESADDSDVDVVLANGTLVFDSLGKVTSGGNTSFSIDRNDTAAVSPMQISLDLTSISGISSAAAGSTLSLQQQDGSSPGTLTSFVIGEDGTISGIFDNGISRTLGQVVLARFSNPQGLVESGNNTFVEGAGSGTASFATPGTFGVGSLRSGAIELSNTDIGRNLVDLILASTNYRGNARVISSIQQLVDELLVLGR
jgi:flagellar hook protein FlgE